MSCEVAKVEEIKAAISSLTARPSTVTALRALLAPSTKTTSASRTKTLEATRKVSRAAPQAKAGSRKVTTAEAIRIHEDISPSLSDKEKYALATELSSLALKVLSNTASKRGTSSREDSPSSVTARNALQTRSSNATSSPASKRTHSVHSTTQSPGPLQHVGSCASLSLAYLASVDSTKIGVRPLPKLQLESAIVALTGRLVGLGLYTQAEEEIRALSKRLATFSSRQGPKKPTGKASAAEKSLIDLFDVQIDLERNPETLPVVVSYHLHLLQLIAATRQSQIVEELGRRLDVEDEWSPPVLIVRQSLQLGKPEWAAKQLEFWSRTLSSLATSLSRTNHESSTAAPLCAFKLHVTALKLRQKWWRLVSHRPDLLKDLLAPFEKALSHLMRSDSAARKDNAIYEEVRTAYQQLDLGAGPDLRETFHVHRSLLIMASEQVRPNEINQWLEHMTRYVGELEPGHALSAVVALREALIHLSVDDGEHDRLAHSLSAVKAALADKISGHRADYDLLLSELAQLVRALRDRTEDSNFSSLRGSILQLSAEFAQRYHRAYAGRNNALLSAILLPVLTQSPDSATVWITVDSPGILIESGILEHIIGHKPSQSWETTWSINRLSVALDQALAALIRRRLSSTTLCEDQIFDDDNLPRLQRAAVLERQLVHLSDHASDPKHQKGVESLGQSIVESLRKLYPVDKHPLRLAKVEILVRRMKASFPSLDIAIFGDPDGCAAFDTLHDDGDLEGYVDDLTAGLGMCRAFSTTSPTATDVKPYLAKWQNILESSSDIPTLARGIHNREVLRSTLAPAARYFGALGDTKTRTLILEILLRLAQLEGNVSDHCSFLVQLALESLYSNRSENAGRCLVQAEHLTEQQQQVPVATILRLKLTRARYFLAIDNLPKAKLALDDAADERRRHSHKEIPRRERKEFYMLHAYAWFLHSKYLFASLTPSDSLVAARRCFKILNSLWSASEQSRAGPEKARKMPPLDDSTLEVDKLVNGVSKLRLTSKASDEQKTEMSCPQRGSASWDLLPLLHEALLHLSDVYAHHGLFPEADNFSARALDVSTSVENSKLSVRGRIHRAMLLVQAERIQNTELCLEQIDTLSADEDPTLAIDLALARARLHIEEKSYEEALTAYNRAEDLARAMSQSSHDLEPNTARNGTTQAPPPRQVKPKLGSTRAITSTTRARTTTGSKSKTKDITNADATEGVPYLMQRIQVKVALAKAVLSNQHSTKVSSDLDSLQARCLVPQEVHQHRQLLFESLLKGAFDNITSDFALSALPESSLAYPVVRCSSRDLTDCDTRPTGSKSRRTGKTTNEPTLASTFNSELVAARKLLLDGHKSSYTCQSTASIYQECEKLSRVTMFVASTSQNKESTMHPAASGLYIDLPRIHSWTCASRTLNDPSSVFDEMSQWEWPQIADISSGSVLSATTYQAEYLDILPECWTAVSMCLNTEADELLISRYRRGSPPFTLRLPFSRNRDDVDGDDPEVDVFDYTSGKSELQDIIEQSNMSCHNSIDTEQAGAKSKWWNERQALDLRLQELLINIENIWLGGFRGVLSIRQKQTQPFSRFRKTIEDILIRHLPSRRNDRAAIKLLMLDDQVLELFTGLGDKEDDYDDLDDQIVDLLYFVVDMLQFGGERNAYDEIDFDRMAVDVADAIRSYHEGCSEDKTGSAHLVLVLEKRLQAFPWESLQCLKGISVSRVGSMQTLRDCLVARNAEATSTSTHADHIVDRTSGTYILNPSTELVSTQATLEPALLKMEGVEDDDWTSIVRRAPTEDEFSSALATSKIMLYFGHGAGSQYIKSRTIRKLEKCSEVVWLIGCSSGAVTEYGQFEPTAVPLTYLQAGRNDKATDDAAGSSKCMAVLAMLWDVTDKDIDRFSLSVGEEWGLWPSRETSKLPSRTPRTRQIDVDPATPKRPSKTPKTPKVHKTPLVAKTPSRSRDRSRSGQNGGQGRNNLTQAVADSREACYLRYLNGAAPVVYGVPVRLS